jgi:hypothetical protein
VVNDAEESDTNSAACAWATLGLTDDPDRLPVPELTGQDGATAEDEVSSN